MPVISNVRSKKMRFSQEAIKSVRAVKSISPKIDGSFHDSEWLHGGKANGFINSLPFVVVRICA